jgi:cytochrome P450
MRTYHGMMLSTIDELFAYWDAGDGGPVDAARDMTKLTLETIGRAAFSQPLGAFADDRPHPFAAAMVTQLEAARRRSLFGAVPGGALLRRRLDRSAAGSLATMTALADDLVARRRADGTEVDDLLGVMLRAEHPRTGERLSDANIRYQILTFLVAGHETTSGTLAFALHYLATHPEIRAGVTAEVDAVLRDDPDAEPAFEDVARFRSVRRVVDETLRLWPTVPAFPRSPREETTLGTGHRMRPDHWAMVLTAMTHRDREVWGEDADEFDPDRFTVERSRGRLPHAYKPFGTGERSCIGRQFALHEAVLLLARLLHRYDVAGEDGYRLQVDERLTLMPAGLRIHLHRRDRRAALRADGAAAVR